MSRSAEVAVDMDLMRKVEALPVRQAGQQTIVPTEAQLAALRKYWKTGRRQTDIAKALGVSVHTARRWYEERVRAER